MSGRFLRHARSKTDRWDSLPARSAEVQAAAAVDPDPAKRAPSRKDTRHLCKGKPGREHVPVIVIAQSTYVRGDCEWGSRFPWHDEPVTWLCHHSEVCAVCQKILREPWDLAPAECPGYPGSQAQHAEAEAEARASAARVAEYQARRRPVITGRQGYRRRRQEAS